MSVTQPTALVTGGARRVGRAIVLRLAEAGFDVAFTYLSSQAESVELLGEIESLGRRGVAIQADLTHPAVAAAEVTRTFHSTFDHLSLLVNNASLYEPSALADASAELARRMYAIHFASPLMLAQAFATELRAERGSIINMLDVLAERPWPKYLAYCASKAALWNLTLSLARELAPDVSVNGIAPGVVEWPDDFPEPDRRKYLSRVPLGRAGTPRDVADAVHYLCTAGRYMTGQVLRIDGGRSIT